MELSPRVCTPNTKEIYKKIDKDEIDCEINDEERVLEQIKLSTQPSATICLANTTPLLNMTKNIQKDFDFYLIAFKINGIAITKVVFDDCVKKNY